MNIRVDKHEYGNVPISHVMGFDPRWFQGLIVHAPPFPIARARAEEIVRARFSAVDRDEPGALWLSQDILRAEELVLLFGGLSQKPDVKGSWVAFVDFRPGDPFGHPCAYWFVGASGDVREVEADFCPLDWKALFVRLQ